MNDFYLDQHGSPHVKIKIKLALMTEVDLCIDTGFSGGIALPNYYENLFNKKIPAVYENFQLADGTVKTFPLFTTKIKFLKKTQDISMMFCNSTNGLAGIEFLRIYRYEMDIKKNHISLKVSK